MQITKVPYQKDFEQSEHYLLIHFPTYDVEVGKSTVEYIFYESFRFSLWCKPTWEDYKGIWQIKLDFTFNFGGMVWEWISPGDLKGMFDMLGRAYGIFEHLEYYKKLRGDKLQTSCWIVCISGYNRPENCINEPTFKEIPDLQ